MTATDEARLRSKRLQISMVDGERVRHEGNYEIQSVDMPQCVLVVPVGTGG
jgi:hypothetical protein